MVIARFAGRVVVAGVGVVELADDERVLPLRQVLRHLVVNLQLAFVDEHHDGDRGDRLGHRRHVEDRVLGHRRAGERAALAEGLVVEDAVLVDHGDGDAGHVTAIGRGLEDRGNGGRSLLRECRRR